MECDHCKNKFKTQSSLNYHKNNAKYCLQKRNQVNIDLVCKDCKKTFSSKHWFNQHKNKCRVNIEQIKKYIQLISLIPFLRLVSLDDFCQMLLCL